MVVAAMDDETENSHFYTTHVINVFFRNATSPRPCCYNC